MSVEKEMTKAGEHHEQVGVSQELSDALSNYTPGSPEEKKLVKEDRPLPDAHFMDYGNAKIAGMGDDLKLTDEMYAWVLSIFFFGYLICEVPSNMVLTRSRPSIFLPGIMIVWGSLCAVMSVSKNYGTILAFRFILGCIESGFFPGVLYLLSSWYTRAELGKRFAIFYAAAVLSGAFGGLLAGGITSGLHDFHGITGWRWLFIVEGVATVGVGIIACFVLLDYPHNSKRLSPQERQLAQIRIVADGLASTSGLSGRLTHWQAFVAAISDPRTYIFIVLFMLDVGAGTISYFIPTITKTLGYSSVKAQYMTVPIYAVATVVLIFAAWSSDRHIERRWHITSALVLGCVGSVVCATVHNPIKRAIVLALVNAFGNFSSVYGSRIWPTKDSPAYHVGFGVTAAFLGTGAILASVLPLLCKITAHKGTAAERAVLAGAQTEERNGAGSEAASAK
ncbi:MFS transporter superfamily [Fusarium oxysporum f. sp. vasinfectum]|nr:MFS transporter superfamily [Fusarium oxysporum f. sp. vasinfectum]